MLDKRMQVLLDEPRYLWLKRRALFEHRSAGEIIRELIDREAGAELDERANACATLLAAKPVEMGDWDELEREIEDSYSGGITE